ncbi:TraR/DksA family transcriptional regulator [Aeromonas veronii]|uniref:TraR/DksA family transcriptional regulator n=1 Tax=Aeromonas veronii TaxID=654 RepID=UPI0029373259|nr:TraR/DksA family transcriptional regulator [Aeromonas veronii]WOE86611.1 TraR/DksA family transcriptional regulator [Aeromonas veronii]
MDLIDRATQHAERMLAAQLDNQIGRSNHQGESLHHCEECGDQIPEARRQHVPGVRLCVSCKSRAERRGQ